MFFNSILGPASAKAYTIGLLVIFAFNLISCSWKPGSSFKWGEDNPPTNQVKLTFENYACLNEFDKKVDSYIKGELVAAEVSSISQCLQSAIVQFRTKTQDLVNGAYSPERLAQFINEDFLTRSKKISPEFLFELMQLKKSCCRR